MKLAVETATNGYLVTDDEGSAPLVIGGHDPIDALGSSWPRSK
jgi:hypothetical protein